jgi:hypothetical protein
MRTDYQKAARRHYDDAELLYDNSRWANADQLYGIAVECILKTIMVGLGASVDPATGDLTKHKKHLQHNKPDKDLWPEFIYFANGRNGAKYAGLLPSPNPFHNWAIEQRYSDGSVFDKAWVEPHLKGTIQVFKILTVAQLNGMI